MYEPLFSRFSNSSTVADWANAAATACRSRLREMSSLAAITLVVVVIVLDLGVVTIVLYMPGLYVFGETVTMRVGQHAATSTDIRTVVKLKCLIAADVLFKDTQDFAIF